MSQRTAHDGSRALREALRAEGGTVAELVDGETTASTAPGAPGPAQHARAGPRARGHAAEYELLFEMILEGSRLHYGAAQVVQTDDPNLALLLGDQLYALGLARLAALGDLEAVAELADVISLVAQANVAEDAGLTEAVWEAGAVAVGWGSSDGHACAKQLARSGSEGAEEALRRATSRSRSSGAGQEDHGSS